METLAKLEELEQKFGENPRRYFAALANEYRKNGEFDQAIELCRAQLEQQPDHLSGRVVLGQALFDAFRYNEARTELTTAIERDPENFIALRLLGELAAQDGDQETAREFLSRARDIEPRNEQLLAALAALGPAEPAVTLSEVVARIKTGPQPVFEPPMERVTEPDAVARTAITAAEPVAEPTVELPVERFAESAVPASTAMTAAGRVAEPAPVEGPVGGVERFAESALGPSATSVAAAPTSATAEARPLEEPAAPAAPTPPPAAPQPVAQPAAQGPLRRERPAAVPRKHRAKAKRVEALVPTKLEPQERAEPQTGPSPEPETQIPTQPATAAAPVEPQTDAQAVERDTAAELQTGPKVAEAESVEPKIEPPTGARSGKRAAATVEIDTPPEPRATIVTETMADLYLEQGHRAEAVEVLRQLVAQKPEDERLSRWLADLEAAPAVSTVRDFFARLGARSGVAPQPAARVAGQSTASLSAVFGESGSTLLDPESAALIAVALPEPAATTTADEFENWVGRPRKP